MHGSRGALPHPISPSPHLPSPLSSHAPQHPLTPLHLAAEWHPGPGISHGRAYHRGAAVLAIVLADFDHGKGPASLDDGCRWHGIGWSDVWFAGRRHLAAGDGFRQRLDHPSGEVQPAYAQMAGSRRHCGIRPGRPGCGDLQTSGPFDDVG